MSRNDESARGTHDLSTPQGQRERTRMENPPAVGAPKNWRWGYLPCGCRNDGYGRHVR